MGAIFRYLAFFGLVGVAGFYCFAVFIGPNGYSTYQRNRQRIERMRQENDKIRDEIKRKQARIDTLESNKAAQEKAVQEITNKAKQDTTVIYLNDTPTTQE